RLFLPVDGHSALLIKLHVALVGLADLLSNASRQLGITLTQCRLKSRDRGRIGTSSVDRCAGVYRDAAAWLYSPWEHYFATLQDGRNLSRLNPRNATAVIALRTSKDARMNCSRASAAT